MQKRVLIVTLDKRNRIELEYEWTWYDLLYMIHTFYCQKRNITIGKRLINMMRDCIEDADSILEDKLKINLDEVDLSGTRFIDKIKSFK